MIDLHLGYDGPPLNQLACLSPYVISEHVFSSCHLSACHFPMLSQRVNFPQVISTRLFRMSSQRMSFPRVISIHSFSFMSSLKILVTEAVTEKKKLKYAVNFPSKLY